MAKKRCVSKSKKINQNLDDLTNTSCNIPELTAEELINYGFTYEEATAWISKKQIQKLFEKNERIENELLNSRTSDHTT